MLQRAVKIAVVVLVLGLVVLSGLGYYLKKQIDSGLIEEQAAAALRHYLGLEVSFGAIRLGTLGSVSLEVVKIHKQGPDDLRLSFDQIEVTYTNPMLVSIEKS